MSLCVDVNCSQSLMIWPKSFRPSSTNSIGGGGFVIGRVTCPTRPGGDRVRTCSSDSGTRNGNNPFGLASYLSFTTSNMPLSK